MQPQNVLGILNQPRKLYEEDNIQEYLDAILENAPEGIRNPNFRQLYDFRRGGLPSFPIRNHATFWSLEIGDRMRNERNLFTGDTWERIWRFVRRQAGNTRPFLDSIAPLMDQIGELKQNERVNIPRNFKLLIEIFYYFFSEVLNPNQEFEEIQVPHPTRENNQINPVPLNRIGLPHNLLKFNEPNRRRRGLANIIQGFFGINVQESQRYLFGNALKLNTWQQMFSNRNISVEMYHLFLTFYHKMMLWAISGDHSNLEKMVLGFDVQNQRGLNYGEILDNPYSLWLKLYLAFVQNLNYRLYKKFIRESLTSDRSQGRNNISIAIPNEMGNLLYWQADFDGMLDNHFIERNDRNTNLFGENNNYPERQKYGLIGQFRGSNVNLAKLAGDFVYQLFQHYPRPALRTHYFNVIFRYFSNMEIPNTVWNRGYRVDNVQISMPDMLNALEQSSNDVDPNDELDREAFGFLVIQLLVHKISQKMLRYLEYYGELDDYDWDAPFQYVQDRLVLNNQLKLRDDDFLNGIVKEVSIIGFRYVGLVSENNVAVNENRALAIIRAFHSSAHRWCDIFNPISGKNCLMQVIEFMLREHHKLFNQNITWDNDLDFNLFLRSLFTSENLFNKFTNHISNGEVWEVLKIYNSFNNIAIKCLLYVYNSNITIFKNEYYSERENVKIILLYNSEIGIMSKNNFDKLESFRRNAKKWWHFPEHPSMLRKVMKKHVEENGEILQYFDKRNQYIIYGKNEEKKFKKVLLQKKENGLDEEWGWEEINKKPYKKRKIESTNANTFRNVDIWGWDVETVILDYKENEIWHKYNCYCICFYNLRDEKKVFWGKDCIIDLIEWLNDLIKENVQNEKDIQKNGKKYILFYSFNGARFDNIFLLKEFLFYFHVNLQLIGKPSNIKCMIIWDLIYFLDARLIFTQGSLQKLSKDLLKEEKKEFDIMSVIKSPALYEEKKEEIIKYCLQDCRLVCKLIEKKKGFIQELFVKFSSLEEYYKFKWFQPTLSLLSINLWKKLFPPDQIIFGSQDWDLYNIEKSSYKGGMCIPIQREFMSSKKNPFLYHYDIVSSYPTAMKNFPMPISYLGDKDYKDKPWNILGNHELKLTSLYLVRFSFVKDFKIPFFPIRINLNSKINGLIYLQSNFENPEAEWIWGIELLVAMPYLERLMCYGIKRYSESIIFYDFIDCLYNERKKAKEEKNDSFAFFLKLVMNSAYGKFGQQKFPTTEIIHGNQFNEYLLDKNLQDKNVQEEDYIQGLKNILPFTEPIQGSPYFIVSHHPDDDLNFIGGCIRISSYIAACARVKLIEGFINVGFENVYYFDTDSIFTTKKMTPENIGEDLGKWSLEHNEIVEAYFVNSKVYAFKTKNETLYKCKGIPKKFLNWEMFQELRQKKECKIEKISQMKFLLSNIYLNEDFVKKVRILDIKRKYKENGDSESFRDLNELINYNKKYLPKKLK